MSEEKKVVKKKTSKKKAVKKVEPKESKPKKKFFIGNHPFTKEPLYVEIDA